MNMLDLMNKMTQLSEAKEKTKTGLKHTAEPGGYGRKDDEDDEGHKVKAAAVKKGKGRPKKDADDSGETKKYDFSAFGVKSGKDVKLPKHDKKKTTVVKGKSQSHAANKADDGTGDEEPKTKAKKKGLKEYFDALDKAIMNESEQIQIKPANQMPKQPGQMSMGQKPAMPGQPQQVAGQPQKQTQVIAQGNRTLGTVDNPQLAQQIKQSIGNGEMTLMPEGEMDEGITDWAKEKYHDYQMGRELGKAGKATMRGDTAAANAANMAAGTHGDKVLSTRYKSTGSTMNKQSSHLPGGEQDATNIARLRQQGKIREADQPSNQMDMGAGLGAGRSQATFESRAKADNKAETAGKKVTKDLEYDMKHKGKDDAKAERAGKKVTKDIEYDEKKKIKEATFKQEYRTFLESKGIKVTNEMLEEGWKEKLAAAGTAAAIGATSLGMMGGLPGQNPSNSSVTKPTEFSQQVQAGQQVHTKAEAMAKVNKQFANEYYTGLNKIDKDYSNGSPKLANQKAVEFTQQLLAKYQANESKKPDANKNGIPDYAEDGKGKNDSKKKKVKEGMEHKLKAARHTGKAHALSKQGYNCGYDDMEEARQYHDGFKEGLDECHGQMPIIGYVGENNPVVNNMASYGAHTPQVEEDMYDEGNAFTGALARTPNGGKFSVGGKSFTDHSTLESTNPFDMNEDADMKSWDSELNSLLNEDINEGLTVSSSTGQQGSPDSVSINATDADAQELLAIVRQAGLGVFGGDEQQPNSAMSQPMTVDGGEGPEADIEVVDDHDGMLSLIRKMTGQGEKVASDDYADEEGDEEHEHEEGEETCSECGGMMEEGHSCGEAVEEDDSMDQAVDNIEQADDNIDQAEEEVAEAEDAPVDDNVSQAGAQQSGEDAALAQAAGQNFADTDEVNEEELEEGYANGNDDTFEADIDFMTKVISGGVNKQKSTGQSTIPVVSTQIDRLGNPMKESTDLLHDWKALSGIK